MYTRGWRARRGGRTVAVVSTLDDLETIAALRRQPGMRLGRDGDRLTRAVRDHGRDQCLGHRDGAAAVRRRLAAPGDAVFACVSGEETGLTGMRRFIDTRRADADVVIELLAGAAGELRRHRR